MDRLNNSVALSSIGLFMGLLWKPEELEIMTQKWREKPSIVDVENRPLKYISPSLFVMDEDSKIKMNGISS